MKKKLVVLLSLVLVMCSSLCACGSGICATCNDEGEILCTNKDCFDGIIRSCDECNGTMRVNVEDCDSCKNGSNLVDCPTCDGTGKVTNPITWQEFTCKACGGKTFVNETCDRCDGEGSTYDECENCTREGEGECPTCKGEIMIDCPDCEKE